MVLERRKLKTVSRAISSLAPISTPPWAAASPRRPMVHMSARPKRAVATLVSMAGRAIARMSLEIDAAPV